MLQRFFILLMFVSGYTYCQTDSMGIAPQFPQYADTLVREGQDPYLTSNQLRVDTSNPEMSVVTREPEEEHSPVKASLYSTFLPGLGQAYNKKYWKIPIIYAALGTSIYFVIDNHQYYQRYRDGYASYYNFYTLEDPNSTDHQDLDVQWFPEIDEDPESQQQYLDFLDRSKNSYRRNRDLSILITGLAYMLQIIDASVDAHLYDWDVSDNLSLRAEPSIFKQTAYTNAFGMRCVFYF